MARQSRFHEEAHLDIGLTLSQGAKKGDIRAIAVATDISPPASPCGMCRQFIREFCEVSPLMCSTAHMSRAKEDTDIVQLTMPILMYDKDGKSVVMTLEKLLPMSFGPEKLKSTEEIAHGLAQ